MTYECFKPRSFNKDSKEIIARALLIIKQYEDKGYVLTLRQLYYQFVARGFLENTMKNYKRLGSILNDARLAGYVSWASIEDRTRYLRSSSSWTNPASIIRSAANSYNIDLWARQKNRIEVWIEKDALVGVVERACQDYDLPYYACRGYSSQSEQWRAGKRFASYQANGQETIVLHLGDHDPSGIDMTRDNEDRLSMFAGFPVKVIRLALNMDQVEKYSPPPNFAKDTDTRHGSYVAKFGEDSWELDALDPEVINDLINDEVGKYIDTTLWDEDKARLSYERAQLTEVADNYAPIRNILAGGKLTDLNHLTKFDLDAVRKVAPYAKDISDRLGDVLHLLGEV